MPAMNTLFRKDSVLFISIDGKEYEVGNPEEPLYIEKQDTSIPAHRLVELLGEIQWIGGVEIYCNADCPDHQYGSCCHPDHCQKKVRLIPKEEIDTVCDNEPCTDSGCKLLGCQSPRKIPKEKKEFDVHLPCAPAKKEKNLEKLAGKLKPNYNHAQRFKTSDKGAMSYSEGDYKQFETPARTNSADELRGTPEPLPITDAIIDPEVGERLNKLIESSESQEKTFESSNVTHITTCGGKYVNGICDKCGKPPFTSGFWDRCGRWANGATTPVESQEELWDGECLICLVRKLGYKGIIEKFKHICSLKEYDS